MVANDSLEAARGRIDRLGGAADRLKSRNLPDELDGNRFVARRTWLEWLNPLARARRWMTFGSVFWLVSATILLTLAFTRKGVSLPASLAIYLLFTVVTSFLAFVFYGVDKYRAAKDKPRISERTLHILSALGGWPGAYLGSRLFRHKTLKMSFRAVFWIIVALHAFLIGYCFLSGWWWAAIKALLQSQSLSS